MNNSEFEKNLKNKMDELASSVDCFDKISKRAFPEENSDYSDCEYTVSDVENITGRRSRFRLTSLIALAAAVAVGVFVLPENIGLLSNVFSDKGDKSDINAYRSLIAEIEEQTEKYEYTYFDCTLKEYIENDVLISPLYECPFEVKEDADINVRVFTRMCGDIPTNQVYAVQYEGKYEDGYFLAAADSKAEFTEEELSAYAESDDTIFPVVETDTLLEVESIFFNENSDEYAGNTSSASFIYNCIYKLDDTIYNTANSIVYFSDMRKSVIAYDYDILSAYMYKGIVREFDSSAFGNGWNTALYNNGSSAFADKSESFKTFNRSDFLDKYETYSFENNLCYTEPFGKFPIKPELGIEFTVCSDIPSTGLPAPVVGESFRIYLPTGLENPRLNYSKSKSVEGVTVDFEPTYFSDSFIPTEDGTELQSEAQLSKFEELVRKQEEIRQNLKLAETELELLYEQESVQELQAEIDAIQKLQDEIQIQIDSVIAQANNEAEKEMEANVLEAEMHKIIAQEYELQQRLEAALQKENK